MGEQLTALKAPSKWDIPLTQGLVAHVDEDDYAYLSQFKWYAHEDGNTYYARRRRPVNEPGGYVILMHRLIMDAPSGIEVDHINRNGLDNRRNNLRLVTRAVNALNRPALNKGTIFDPRYKSRPYKSRYRGTYLGQFATKEEAHAAYDKAREADPDAN